MEAKRKALESIVKKPAPAPQDPPQSTQEETSLATGIRVETIVHALARAVGV